MKDVIEFAYKICRNIVDSILSQISFHNETDITQHNIRHITQYNIRYTDIKN